MRPVLCLAALPLLATAAPSSTLREDGAPPPAFSYKPAVWRAPSAYRVVRDWLVETIALPPQLLAGAGAGHREETPRTTSARHRDASDAPRHVLAQYGNDLVLRFNTSTSQDANALLTACDDLFLDVWGHTAAWTDVRLARDAVPSLLGLLPPALQHSHSPMFQSPGLVRAIQDSYEPYSEPWHTDPAALFAPHPRHRVNRERSVFFEQYRPWNVIVSWMRLLESMFPSHVRLVSVGQTFEGREIYGLRIGVLPTDSQQPVGPRKTILITAGLHAREWISTSTATYIAYNLITQYGHSRQVDEMVEQFDWVILPSLNPDGYVYTWTADRLWRKNRQPTSLRFCSGVDLDRSFGFMWSGDYTAGNPCSENYAGETAFDGAEAAQLANWMNDEVTKRDTQFVSLFDLHSYAQEVLYPYSYSCADEPPTVENLEEMGQGFAKAIRSSGNVYSVLQACKGNVTPMANPAGGSLLDWVYHQLQVKVAFQFKLRDVGSWGFLLPKEYIKPVGDEILDAVLYLGQMLTRGNSAEASGGPDLTNQQVPLMMKQMS